MKTISFGLSCLLLTLLSCGKKESSSSEPQKFQTQEELISSQKWCLPRQTDYYYEITRQEFLPNGEVQSEILRLGNEDVVHVAKNPGGTFVWNRSEYPKTKLDLELIPYNEAEHTFDSSKNDDLVLTTKPTHVLSLSLNHLLIDDGRTQTAIYYPCSSFKDMIKNAAVNQEYSSYQIYESIKDSFYQEVVIPNLQEPFRKTDQKELESKSFCSISHAKGGRQQLSIYNLRRGRVYYARYSLSTGWKDSDSYEEVIRKASRFSNHLKNKLIVGYEDKEKKSFVVEQYKEELTSTVGAEYVRPNCETFLFGEINYIFNHKYDKEFLRKLLNHEHELIEKKPTAYIDMSSDNF